MKKTKCPGCKLIFKVKKYVKGQCPKCGRIYDTTSGEIDWIRKEDLHHGRNNSEE